MAFTDTVLKMVTRHKEKEMPIEVTARERFIKTRAGMVINVFAALLAFNMWLQGSLNSKVMNNTIQANDLWAFYQAKSIKQTQYELAAQQAQDRGNFIAAAKYQNKAESYESDVSSGEGKKELFVRAKALEAERDHHKEQLPWVGYASTAYQLSIVLLSASILSISMALFWGSFVVAGAGLVLMLQGLFLFF